jgi:DNA-binding transcriptional ArsR family regulator
MLIDKSQQSQNHEINALQAEFFAAVADTSRVKIIYTLSEGPLNVKSLAARLGISHSATSRHLKILREKNLVDSHRQGHTVLYSLAAPQVLKALDIFLDILNNQISHQATLIKLERYHEDQ